MASLQTLEPTARWRIAPPAPTDLRRALPDVHPLVLGALARRGLATPDVIRAFVDRAPGDDNPFRLAGMNEAVTRLRTALRRGERIAVYGDYDADGVTATAVLMETFTALGADVAATIPHREREGYGLHVAALDRLAAAGVRVVVTVDCGIRSAGEVAHAVARGMDVIVTDHHALPGSLPSAVAVVNPHRPDCRYGFTDLSGVGLAFKLAQALLRAEAGTGRRTPALDESDLLDLVAIGTVADVVPLVGENRALVERGLDRLRSTERPGLSALLAAARRAPESLTARDLAFVVGPRLNAAGRMDDARLALELLLTRDAGDATALAARLEAHNEARRAATDAAVTAAEAALAERTDAPFLFYADGSVALGVTGLVAGRLTSRHYRPSAVARIDGDVARASARSIPEFNITAALDEVSDRLVRFGGHARAAGFTARTGDLGAVVAHLTSRAAAAFEGCDLRPVLDIDAVVAGSDLDWPLFDALACLEPIGEGNPRPLLLWRAAPVASPRPVGAGHLRFVVETPPPVGSLDAIAFGGGPRLTALGDRADLVFSLEANTWQGNRRLELRIEDMAAPSA
jgi:single-stranded-DNA-specific exonuclease